MKVKVGKCLSQLRLFYGKPDDVQLKGEELFKTVLHGDGERDGSLSVELSSVRMTAAS